ncbi:MAG: Rrf2 family transcriptional regulator [Clostridiales bacterium]|nr:Rrf2 family transcriptional regulator [Clostridiales bacterium]
MLISTKGRYGVMIMVYLAENYNKGHKPLKEIAASQELSEKYLEQIINPLTKAGLLTSYRGSQGGYALAKAPADVSVGEILRILEGSLAPVYCVAENGETCEKLNSCNSVVVWKKIKDAIDNVVDNMSLSDLIDEENKNKNIG